MARKRCAQFLRSCIAVVALPLLCLALASFSACERQNNRRSQGGYCGESGCYACGSEGRCYPAPTEPTQPAPALGTRCDNDAACGAGHVCNLGRCEAACKDNSSCSAGLSCISGRCRPGDSAACGVTNARCISDNQCGANQHCVNRVCASNCVANQCPLGQVCQSGSCIEDPAPASAQCVFDTDCGGGKGGFRCINAYCLPVCNDNSTCLNGASCLKGLCRGSR